MKEVIVILFSLIAIIALFPPPNKRVENLLFWIFGFCTFLLAAFRLIDNSPDYSTYLDMYNNYDTLVVEPSFTAISWFVKTFFDAPIFLFIIYAAIAVYIKLKVIKTIDPKLIFLGLLTYISLTYIIQEHAQIRAGVATAFFLLTIKPLYERNWKHFLFFSFCSILFHVSAIIILPLWFVAKPNVRGNILWCLIPLGYVVYFSGINIISTAIPIPYVQDKLLIYQSFQESSKDGFDQINVFGFGVILKCFFFYILLYFKDKIRLHNQYIDLLLMIYGIAIFFIPAFATMPVVSFRLSAILVSVEFLIFPMFYYVFKPLIISRFIVVIIAAVNLFISYKILSA